MKILRRGVKSKITEAQRDEIFNLYLTDRAGAADLCERLGVHRGYAPKLASERGVVLGKRMRVLTQTEKAAMRNKTGRRSDANDARWAWARERGEVSA